MKTSLRRLLRRSDAPSVSDKQVLIQDVPPARRAAATSEVLGGVFVGEDGQRYKLIEVEVPDRLTFGRTDK